MLLFYQHPDGALYANIEVGVLDYSNPQHPCKISNKFQFWINLVMLLSWCKPSLLALKAIQARSVARFLFSWTDILRAVPSSLWLCQCWCGLFIVPLINSILVTRLLEPKTVRLLFPVRNYRSAWKIESFFLGGFAHFTIWIILRYLVY